MNFIKNMFRTNPAESASSFVQGAQQILGSREGALFTRQIGRDPLPPGNPLSSSEARVSVHPSFSENVCSAAAQVFQEKIDKKKGKNREESPEFKIAYLLNCLNSDDPLKWAEANVNIQSMQRLGKLGTGHIAHEGGYDFVITSLTTILWQFGKMGYQAPGRLNSDTEKYMLDVLMNFDDTQESVGGLKPNQVDKILKDILDLEADSYDIKCPQTLGLVEESENHTWMILSSLYLIYEYKTRDSQLNDDDIVLTTNSEKRLTNKEIKEDLEKRIGAFITYTQHAGFYEFNSRPYVGFTLHPLLNLEAFSSEKIKNEARELLDYLNACYALSSYDYKRFPPFCRNVEKARDTSLTSCHHSAYFRLWTESPDSLDADSLKEEGRFQRAAIGTSLPYRPKEAIVDRMMNKTTPYLAQIGHGNKTTAEIYYGGNGVLLSAGGVKVEGDHGEVVVRPITIITGNDAKELRDIHKLGNILTEEELAEKMRKGANLKMGFHSDCSAFNNTGVYENFACSRGKYVKAGGSHPLANSKSESMEKTMNERGFNGRLQYGTWKVFELNPDSLLAVYSTEKNESLMERFQKSQAGVEDLGIFAIFNKNEIGNVDPEQLILDIIEKNGKDSDLQRQFIFPYSGTKLVYDVDAPQNQWVMISKTEVEKPGEEHQTIFDRDFGHWPLLDVQFPVEKPMHSNIETTQHEEEKSG